MNFVGCTRILMSFRTQSLGALREYGRPMCFREKKDKWPAGDCEEKMDTDNP